MPGEIEHLNSDHCPAEKPGCTLLAIVGPTAAGKSDLALFLAEELNGEIVNCDSVQIYRYFDIGTAKPAPVQRRGIAHHLLDILEPQELCAMLGLPDQVVPVAYLCMGYVTEFPDAPDLQRAGWRHRLPLSELVHVDRWENRVDGMWDHAGFDV